MKGKIEIGFQTKRLKELIGRCKQAQQGYKDYGDNQILSMTAPTGSGKTMIMAELIESFLRGSQDCPAQENALFLWLSDDPELNRQSRLKIEKHAELLNFTCITIDGDFDKEELQDGKVYFLNTDKLRVGSKLVSNKKDERNYSIWQTLQNTREHKGQRFFVIIDEAHRGMKEGKEKQEANSIIQKFILGSPSDNLEPMPIIIGMSATIERFNKLIEHAEANKLKPVNITPAEVRSFGLLKDKIEIKYAGENQVQMDFSVLKCAAHEWMEKCKNWHEYCKDKPEKVNPIFIIQVENKNDKGVSSTDLEACMEAIEEETGMTFNKGEVVHTFGEKDDLRLNGLVVPYMDPSRIQDDESVKIVFFKDKITTGWDCPRAETMMSFRRATDPTYIAQLMGRMVRTPLKRRIREDNTLNNVHLYLPYFDKKTAETVVKALMDEGYDNVSSGSANSKEIQTLSLSEKYRDVYEWIKSIQLDTWLVKKWKINSYLTSLTRLATLLMTKGVDVNAKRDVVNAIVGKVATYIDKLKADSLYEDKIGELSKYMLKGGSLEFLVDKELTESEGEYNVVTEQDIEREFKYAETRLSSLGIGISYCKYVNDDENIIEHKKEFILFTLSEECMEEVENDAKERFLNYQNQYGGVLSEMCKDEYDPIIRDGDEVSCHKWEYTVRDEFTKNDKMEHYDKHMLVDENRQSFFKLDEWEDAALKEEMAKEGFHCWIRNLPRKPWSLSIKYEDKTGWHDTYPDLIIIRKDNGNYSIVLLEPHWEIKKDNYYKAKGMLEYSKQNEQVSRIELIRMVDDNLWRLDFKDAVIRNKMKDVKDNEMLDVLFHKMNKPL